MNENSVSRLIASIETLDKCDRFCGFVGEKIKEK